MKIDIQVRNSSPKNSNSVVIYLLSCSSKPVWLFFFWKCKRYFEKCLSLEVNSLVNHHSSKNLPFCVLQRYANIIFVHWYPNVWWALAWCGSPFASEAVTLDWWQRLCCFGEKIIYRSWNSMHFSFMHFNIPHCDVMCGWMILQFMWQITQIKWL